MANTNCLAGMACPQCGYADKFLVGCAVMAEVTDEGTEAVADFDYSDESYCECSNCGHKDTIAGFTLPITITVIRDVWQRLAEYDQLMIRRNAAEAGEGEEDPERLDVLIDDIRDTVFDMLYTVYQEMGDEDGDTTG